MRCRWPEYRNGPLSLHDRPMNKDAWAEARVRLERAREAVERLERHRITSFKLVSQSSTPFDQFTDGAAVQSPRTEEEYPPFRAEKTAWWQFLLAAAGIYSKLEQGAKDYPQSTAWFGKRKRQRKVDPLLRYLHQARNAEEHGIRGSSYSVATRATNPGRGVKIVNNEEGELVRLEVPQDIPLGAPVAQLIPAGVRLVPVLDGRSRQTFHPPREHLGIAIPVEPPLSRDHPLTVARPALRYLEEMVEDAKKLLE